MNWIKFDFGKTMNQANQLEEISEDLKRISQSSLPSTMNQMAQGWNGEGAVLFQRKMKMLEKKIYNSAKALEKVSSDIKHSAVATYNAELRAKEIAQTRERHS